MSANFTFKGYQFLSAAVVPCSIIGLLGYNSIYSVDGGHRAVIFDRFKGVKDNIYGEGIHFRIPWFQTPTIFDIRTRPKQMTSATGTRDLQIVNVSIRILYRPDAEELPYIFSKLGTDFDMRVLPSIIPEVLKSVMAQFNAEQLITNRAEVSLRIKNLLIDESQKFKIKIEDVSLTHLSFSREYGKAVEDKQVAQQDAARAKYLVEKAYQDKLSTIIKATGEAKSAELVGLAIKNNPAFLELRSLQAAKEIANSISNSENKVYLDSESLLMNLKSSFDTGKKG